MSTTEFRDKSLELFHLLRKRYDVVIMVANRYQPFDYLTHLYANRQKIDSAQLTSFAVGVAGRLISNTRSGLVFGNDCEIAEKVQPLVKGEVWGVLLVVRTAYGQTEGVYYSPRALETESPEIAIGDFPQVEEIKFDFLYECLDLVETALPTLVPVPVIEGDE